MKANPFFDSAAAATSETPPLSLHDALPISSGTSPLTIRWARPSTIADLPTPGSPISTGDRKSTRLNYSHVAISYAVFCLEKKNAGFSLGQADILRRAMGKEKKAELDKQYGY